MKLQIWKKIWEMEIPVDADGNVRAADYFAAVENARAKLGAALDGDCRLATSGGKEAEA